MKSIKSRAKNVMKPIKSHAKNVIHVVKSRAKNVIHAQTILAYKLTALLQK